MADRCLEGNWDGRSYFNAPVTKVIWAFCRGRVRLAGATLSPQSADSLGLKAARIGAIVGQGLVRGADGTGGVPDFFVGALLLLGFAVIWPVLLLAARQPFTAG